MNKVIKPILFIALVIILFGLIIVIFRSDVPPVKGRSNLFEHIENEIQKRLDEEMDVVYPQLERQNALDSLEFFREIIYPNVRLSVYMDYGIDDIHLRGGITPKTSS